MTHPLRFPRLVALAAGLALSAAVSGCGGSGSSSCAPAGTVTFAQAEPIFAANCTRCHSSTLSGGARSGAPAGIDYDTYASAKEWASAGVAAVESGRMPLDNPGAVSSADSCTLQAWVDQGAKP